jgi:hypothetical protein
MAVLLLLAVAQAVVAVLVLEMTVELALPAEQPLIMAAAAAEQHLRAQDQAHPMILQQQVVQA